MVASGYNPLSGAKTGTRVRQVTSSRQTPISKGASSGGWGDAQRQANVIVPGLVASRTPVTARTLREADTGYLANSAAGRQLGPLPTAPGYRPSSSGGGGRGGGGGGGPTGMSQEQLDWIAQLLSRGGPQQATAGVLDLPDITGTFDPTMYNELEGKLGAAVGQSRGAADEAYTNLGNYLTSNFKNAYAAGPPQAQAPGMDAASMQRMLQSQGVGPEAVAANQQGAAAGNAAFQNLWALGAANENTAQQNRLNRVQTDRGTTNRAIDAAQLQGQTGIGLQRGQAQTAFNERLREMQQQQAQQEAMANWTRQNQVGDLNTQTTNEYRNQQIQALLGLLPGLAQGVQMPDLSQFGF
jgi:hypothetical protein